MSDYEHTEALIPSVSVAIARYKVLQYPGDGGLSGEQGRMRRLQDLTTYPDPLRRSSWQRF